MSAWKALVLAGSMFCIARPAAAADLNVIAGGGIAAPLKEFAAQFEKQTGHKLTIRYGTAPELMKMAAAGPFDLGVVPVEVMKNDAARAAFAATRFTWRGSAWAWPCAPVRRSRTSARRPR